MQNDTHAFVVRIWPEALDCDGSIKTWRGSIEHVEDGQRLHFCDLEEVVRFIQEQVGLATWQRGGNRPRDGASSTKT